MPLPSARYRTEVRRAWYRSTLENELIGMVESRRRMEILVAESLDNPEVGFGLQQAVLEEVAAGERGPAALIWTSPRYVGATRQETRLSGFAQATEAATELGFPVLVRNSGGGAVAANRGSLSFSLTFPVEDLRHGLYERYSEGLDLIASALRTLRRPAGSQACRPGPACHAPRRAPRSLTVGLGNGRGQDGSGTLLRPSRATVPSWKRQGSSCGRSEGDPGALGRGSCQVPGLGCQNRREDYGAGVAERVAVHP